MMKRHEAFDHLRRLAALTSAPSSLTANEVRALAEMLPELLEVLADWSSAPPPGPVAEECYAALRVVGDRHGLEACDPSGRECYFPRCLADGCEAESDDRPAEPSGPSGETTSKDGK